MKKLMRHRKRQLIKRAKIGAAAISAHLLRSSRAPLDIHIVEILVYECSVQKPV